MKTRHLLLSALVLAIGVSIFYAGARYGGRRTSPQAPKTADVSVPKSIEQPPKPEPPPVKPVAKAAGPVKPSPTKAVSKVIASDKEYARGNVTDPEGRPLMGAEITIGGAWVTHAVTGSDGKFRIEVPQIEWKPGG